jgi:hypothetical protein
MLPDMLRVRAAQSSSVFFLIADIGMAVLAVSDIGVASSSPLLDLEGNRRLVRPPGVAVAADIGSFRKNPR